MRNTDTWSTSIQPNRQLIKNFISSMKLLPTALLGRFTSAVSHAARSAVLINILLEKLVTTNTALHDEENYISDKNTIVKMYFKC